MPLKNGERASRTSTKPRSEIITEYSDFFAKAVGGGYKPYPYQTRLAGEAEMPKILKAPTGAGKTEAVILGWLYRKFEHPDAAVRESEPRRLVYCLPMRTLVEQI